MKRWCDLKCLEVTYYYHKNKLFLELCYYVNLPFFLLSQNLAFSDDESPPSRDNRREMQRKELDRDRAETASAPPTVSDNRGGSGSSNNASMRGWGPNRSSGGNSQPATPQTGRGQGNRVVEDEEVWNQRRRQHSEEVAIAVERAKLRKEEEEKRFIDVKQVN